jgi:hypothetical protein
VATSTDALNAYGADCNGLRSAQKHKVSDTEHRRCQAHERSQRSLPAQPCIRRLSREQPPGRAAAPAAGAPCHWPPRRSCCLLLRRCRWSLQRNQRWRHCCWRQALRTAACTASALPPPPCADSSPQDCIHEIIVRSHSFTPSSFYPVAEVRSLATLYSIGKQVSNAAVNATHPDRPSLQPTKAGTAALERTRQGGERARP